MKMAQAKAIQEWAEAADIKDELSLFEDKRPPIDKPGDGIKYVKVEGFDVTGVVLPEGYTLYRKVKTNE